MPCGASTVRRWWAIPKKWRKRFSATAKRWSWHFLRLTFQMDVAELSQEKLLRSIELLGSKVAPVLRGKA